MVICTSESRPFDLTGAKLLLLSLMRHCPDAQVQFIAPDIHAGFAAWARRVPSVRLRERPELRDRGWNIKPAVLLELLDEGHDEVVWLDADVIVTADPRPLLKDAGSATLVATEEPAWGMYEGGTHRTVAWGLRPGRVLDRTVNSCLLRVTPAHRPLLVRLQELLESDLYRAAQREPWSERPQHLLGDQEVLTALLGSAEFADVPFRLLRRGTDIVQSFNAATYTISERLDNGPRRLPPLVHAMRQKPWRNQEKPSWTDLREFYNFVSLELSPYNHVAAGYRDELDEPADWLDVRSLPGRSLHRLAAGRVNFQGLPLALTTHMLRRYLPARR
jgi:hypothetical protein